jgi:hypothetical protein
MVSYKAEPSQQILTTGCHLEVSSGAVDVFQDSGVGGSFNVGKETVGIMLATSIVAFFVSL